MKDILRLLEAAQDDLQAWVGLAEDDSILVKMVLKRLAH